MLYRNFEKALYLVTCIIALLSSRAATKTCTTESFVDFSDLSAIPLVPGDLGTVPNPYHSLAYSAGFAVAADGVEGQPNPLEIIFYALTTEVRAAPSITSQYDGSPVLSFLLRTFDFLCTLETGQADVGVAETCSVQVSGFTTLGEQVSTLCKYTASGDISDVTSTTCTLPSSFTNLLNASFATVSPATLTAAFVTSFLSFDFLLTENC